MKLGTAICIVGLAAIGAYLVVNGHGEAVAEGGLIVIAALFVMFS